MGSTIENESGNGTSNVNAPLPHAASLASQSRLEGEVERNPIFDALVGSDGDDVAGLVAYSIYKQNKRAWLDDFVRTTGRAPSEAETRSYIIGESTERRLSTYRRLAASTLAGKAPGAGSGNARLTRIAAGALWALAIIVALAVVGLAVHAGYFNGAK
jgi:hypothetical protein